MFEIAKKLDLTPILQLNKKYACIHHIFCLKFRKQYD